jgi:hypothetical protein
MWRRAVLARSLLTIRPKQKCAPGSGRLLDRTTSTSEGRRSANTCIAGWMQKGRLTIDRHTSFRTATRTSPDRTSDLLSAELRVR